jgi:hypothetical protein
VGLYENETSHRAWAIRVTSENPFTFEIAAGHLENSSERVDAKALKPSITSVTLSDRDCQIVLAKSDVGMKVTQTGVCAGLGFPANDDLSMSDANGADFSRIDETKACFDKTELAVGSTSTSCTNPL